LIGDQILLNFQLIWNPLFHDRLGMGAQGAQQEQQQQQTSSSLLLGPPTKPAGEPSTGGEPEGAWVRYDKL